MLPLTNFLIVVFLSITTSIANIESSSSSDENNQSNLTTTLVSSSIEEIDFDDFARVSSPAPSTLVINRTSHLIRSPPFKQSKNELHQVTMEDLTEDLATWKSPLDTSKTVLYYTSGYDYDDRPIWVVEFANLDLKTLLAAGPEATSVNEKWVKQAVYRVSKSLRNSSDTGELVSEISYIADMDGFNLGNLSHLPSLNYLLRLASQYRTLIVEHLGQAIMINSNAISIAFMNLIRPIFREAMAKVDIYGTDKRKWLAVLHSKFPKQSLAPKYGGMAQPIIFS